MILVGLLTNDQKNQLVGKKYTDYSFYEPLQDDNNNWILSIQEIEATTNDKFMWVHNLPMIEYKPKITTYEN